MKYIVVTLPDVPKEPVPCAYCSKLIGKGYTRDLMTNLVYHSHECLLVHIFDTQRALGGLDAPTLLLRAPTGPRNGK